MEEYDIKQIFQEIEDRLISSMKRNLYTHRQDEKLEGFDWGQWQAHKLKSMQKYREENKEIFGEYSDLINRYSYKSIKSQFKEGANKVNKEAIKSGFISKEDSQLGGSFFKMNTRKVNALVDVVKSDMKDVKTATLRFMNDTYRSTIYKAQIFAGTGAGTLQQAIDMATHDFLKKGINCIEYKDGRRVNIADYCDMAVKTAQTRATLMGEGELRKDLGVSLVYVTKHNTSCPKCSQWQGRIYIDDVWSGGTKEDGKYPMLSTAIAGGLFHPRCRHGMSTYFEDINEVPEDMQENEHNHEDEYVQELERRKREYERLALGSFDNKEYKNKANDLQKEIEDSKINWKDFENIDEAKEYVYNNYNDADIDKIKNVESINITCKTLNELQKKYPLNQKIYIRNKTMSKAAATGNYQGIQINTSHFNKARREKIVGKKWIEDCNKQIEELKQYLGDLRYKQKPIERGIRERETMKRFKCFSVSNSYQDLESIKATISHEYGHVIADQYFGQINKFSANKNFDYYDSNDCWKKCRDVTKTYKRAIKEDKDILDISYYASTNEYEFFAECFAKREMGEKLPNYINEMLERVLNDGK